MNGVSFLHRGNTGVGMGMGGGWGGTDTNESAHKMNSREENSPAAYAGIRARNVSINSPALLPRSHPGLCTRPSTSVRVHAEGLDGLRRDVVCSPEEKLTQSARFPGFAEIVVSRKGKVDCVLRMVNQKRQQWTPVK